MDTKFNAVALKLLEAVKILGSVKQPKLQSDLDATAHTIRACAASLLAYEVDNPKGIDTLKPKS